MYIGFRFPGLRAEERGTKKELTLVKPIIAIPLLRLHRSLWFLFEVSRRKHIVCYNFLWQEQGSCVHSSQPCFHVNRHFATGGSIDVSREKHSPALSKVLSGHRNSSM